MGIVLIILVLSLVIVIHEYGHYRMMRRNGIEVAEFTIGFGPNLFERQLKSGTYFRIKPLLIGGYARPSTDGQKKLESSGAWVKFQVYVGGMLMNAIVAFLIFTAFGYITGKVPVVIIPYIKWAPAWLLPLVSGFLLSFGLWLATPVIVVVMLVKMGMGFFAQAAGPIGIVQLGHQVAQQTPDPMQLVGSMVLLFASINSAIAGFNLMPLLPFDGGHIFGLLIKKLFGKRTPKAMTVFGWVSAAVVIFLIVMIFHSDIMRLITGGSLIPR